MRVKIRRQNKREIYLTDFVMNLFILSDLFSLVILATCLGEPSTEIGYERMY